MSVISLVQTHDYEGNPVGKWSQVKVSWIILADY